MPVISHSPAENRLERAISSRLAEVQRQVERYQRLAQEVDPPAHAFYVVEELAARQRSEVLRRAQAALLEGLGCFGAIQAVSAYTAVPEPLLGDPLARAVEANIVVELALAYLTEEATLSQDAESAEAQA